MPIDPVCGMVIPKDNHQECTEYANQHFCFCSAECKEEFDRDPDVFLYDYEDTEMKENQRA